ncbi:1-phosphatidylinositol 4,5-bisphosphate phosphodiesterase zeta-1-like [Oncorhynchus tshawytscha]|uniref:1-phosphatidylinositol 4,5-bisphosphate phosphodiesterase zeta-1-like n=1 Tax=Oncorhynchus tshawytscha TaxID=74940 RepID=UPI001C3E5D9A|nr:1-phosphatidylinositol 4,5-bisphosphate phosphodiesterase zeta-1-like [Oncorhynchus tshawytscha]
MKKNKASTSRRSEIQDIYQCYSSGRNTLAASALLRFLHMEQMEVAANQETAEGLIDRYEIEETARENRSMTFEGFYRYMESKDCSVFDQIHTSVYQDMDQPLCHYFISSSHNTYLTGDQLVGKSTLDAYVSALRRGCRCLEIDCWDGPSAEPIVYHGHTLTSKILFKDVITTVEQHAFEVSPYPVILSLENHCTPTQQDVMAQYLTSILGEKLLATSLDLTNQPGQLPSPNELKYKILIKNKKLSPQKDRRERDSEGEDSEEEDDDDDEEEEPNLKTKHHSKLKRKKVIAESLSNLVVYTKSVKFHSFSHAREHQQYYENTSLGEKKAHKLVKTSAPDFVQHNMVFITRIYPAASRTLSSNYNPQGFWNVGSQMVALNFQSLGLPMDLNNGRFQDNGGCGYVLKPLFLRTNQWGFNPNSYRHNLKPAHLLLKVISGSNLPVPRSGKALDPFVRVEIHSVHSDSCRRHTDTVRHNSLSPRWDSAMNFTISVPELSLIRFTVRDQTGLTSEFIGQYTIPFISMKKGYRWVPLLSREGYSLDPASLFIFIWYS